MGYVVILKDLPCKIKAFTVKNADDTYTIVVNSKLNYEQQQKSFEHELRHIVNCDFEKNCDVNIIEKEAHKR